MTDDIALSPEISIQIVFITRPAPLPTAAAAAVAWRAAAAAAAAAVGSFPSNPLTVADHRLPNEYCRCDKIQYASVSQSASGQIALAFRLRIRFRQIKTRMRAAGTPNMVSQKLTSPGLSEFADRKADYNQLIK
jgi:hypothetical protein